MSRVNPFPTTYSPARVLVGIITAHHPSRKEHIEKMREQLKTKGCPFIYRFIYGDINTQNVLCESRPPKEDELFLAANDTKPFMVEKCKALFQWALDHGFTHVLRICDDTLFWPDRLMKNIALLVQHDYAGTMCGYATIASLPGSVFTLRYLDYMHGGVGIWLSAKAMRMLIDDVWKGPYSSPYPNNIEITPGNWHKGSWGVYWDDLWIGEVLKGNLNFSDPRRNDIYENYLVQVLDAPNLFASNFPYDDELVICAHSHAQMGTSDVKPQAYSTRTGVLTLVAVQWDTAKSSYYEVKPK
jgi:hypothetical protein